MALLTRLQARTLIQELIDDTAAKLWSAANLDILAEAALDELWGELLDQWPWLRSTESAGLTPTAPGFIDVSTALTRFYRLQSVGTATGGYYLADPKDIALVNGVVLNAPDNSFAFYGSQLYLFPLSVAASSVFVRYCNRPTAFTALATDATVVDWPEGYHLAYIYDAAARALEKGDREKSDTFKDRAATSMFRLKAFLRKQTLGGVMPWTPDSSLDWGSTT